MSVSAQHARAAAWLAAVAVAALPAGACGSSTGNSPTSAAQPPPSPAKQLSRQAGRLLPGGPPAFRRQLVVLRGTPVVVNQWASWCGPCRHEFPFFARLAARYHGRVAFLGVNAQDSERAARRFLTRYRTPFPHFFDPSTATSRVFRGGFAWPSTAFYDARGKLTYTKAGGYPTQAALDRDIRRYALRRPRD